MKLEEKVKASNKEQPAGFFKDPSKVISIAAFIISIATTVFAWRKENIDAQIAQRRQLDSTIQQLIDVGFKNFEFLAKNRNDPNMAGMTGWFATQTGMLAQKAAQELALSKKGGLVDYMVVGNALLEANQPKRAMELFQRAVQIGQANQVAENTLLRRLTKQVEYALYGEDLDQIITDEQRPHHMSSAYSAWGVSLIAQDKLDDAAKQFNNGKSAVENSSYPEYYKKQLYATVHKFWGEALARYNYSCILIKAQMEQAEALYPDNLKIGNYDWNAIQSQAAWLRANCGPDGRIVTPIFPSFPSSEIPQPQVQNSQSPQGTSVGGLQSQVQSFQSAPELRNPSVSKSTQKPIQQKGGR